MQPPKDNVVIAITGASGAIYAKLLIHRLAKDEGINLNIIASHAGSFVYEFEIGTTLDKDLPDNVRLYREDEFTAPFASGSVPLRAMVIVPCTMATLGAIAWSSGRNLIHRVADVCLKERRRLILVPRETPLHEGHLENMLRCVRLGALILPAMPGFYHKPSTIEDLANFVVSRILNHLDMSDGFAKPWNYEKEEIERGDHFI
ncbi:MAG: UbiX family flavin prenyltransferase [Syntrophobacterales bacterium]|nr:UbiX family flavin prenyltransferase [Syntrophobacterales bacterium]